MAHETDLEILAERLEASDGYQVLRRIAPRERFNDDDGSEMKIGLIIDTETTGLDPRTDEIIELAMLTFTFSPDGRVFDVVDVLSQLNDPGRPISPEITRLTGIDDDMVAGQSIEWNQVSRFAAPAIVIIAHNAGFDRPFVERYCDVFASKAWACSWSEIPWNLAKINNTKLDYVAMRLGLFFDGHRALEDCRAVLEILARPLPGGEIPTLKLMLDNARKPTFRLWAENSPFELKDQLKNRGYRWNDGTDGRSRAWYADINEDELESENRFLREEIYQRDVDVPASRINAFDRYSSRV